MHSSLGNIISIGGDAINTYWSVLSTEGGYHQHCRGSGVPSVMCSKFSTLKNIQYSGGYYQFYKRYYQSCEAYLVLCRDTINTLAVYHQYCGEYTTQ